jgi:two-component system sensor histidine kinase BaeS
VRRTLTLEVFLAIAAVGLASVGLAGLLIRLELERAFARYVAALPGPMGGGMGAGRHYVLGGAERTFLASLDRGILVASLAAFALAAIAAVAFAWYLTRPLERLQGAAEELARGRLGSRVQAGGPYEVKRLGEAFNSMADSLQEQEELRRRMTADVAHELRNPVAALRAQVEGLAEGVLPADRARFESLAEDTRHLSRLVGDLQELSLAEAGELRYDMATLDLAELGCRHVEAAREGFPGGVELVCDAAGPVMVTGDELRLGQVLRNLLDNARRHTSAGSVTVAVGRAGDRAHLEVRDTGEGIPAEDLPYVFERFYRADGARARDTGGSGIGLAVARRIVEDHGGAVFAKNGETGGAVVGFDIPAA